ncbi:MAG TPA: Gfo/Idh/MocA family oxidoreductase, partial [Pyrinomonadaceae bacterium]|nr:Gfo/Idh/MocA family oxidoreductase [Pyrinomonadaceae bacterium]
ETRRMLGRARESGRLALVDHELRFLPARRLAREMIQGGELGQVHHARFTYRADARAATDRPWDWWSDRASGGGALGAIGSHAVDTLCWLLGARVSEVFCSLATHVRERPDSETGAPVPVTTDDEALLTLRLEGGAAAETATGLAAVSVVEMGRSEHAVEVFGSEGALRVSGADGLWRSRRGMGEWREVEAASAPLAPGMPDTEWSRGFTVFAREIVSALREGRDAVEGAATFDDGHRTQLVLDAARLSDETGRRVSVEE